MPELILGFSRETDGDKFKAVLTRHGYHVVSVCRSGANILNAANRIDSGIILCSYRLTDMICADLYPDLPESFQMIVLSKEEQADRLPMERAVFLSMPVSVRELLQTVEMVSATMTRRARRKKPAKRSEEEEKILNRAKEYLMERNKMSEPEAHRYIQKISMTTGTSLIETAEKIITVYE